PKTARVGFIRNPHRTGGGRPETNRGWKRVVADVLPADQMVSQPAGTRAHVLTGPLRRGAFAHRLSRVTHQRHWTQAHGSRRHRGLSGAGAAVRRLLVPSGIFRRAQAASLYALEAIARGRLSLPAARG